MATVGDTPTSDASTPLYKYLETYIKGDRDYIDSLLCVGISAVTNDPENLGVMAPSSEGKTYPMAIVASLFPNAIKLAGMSPTAVFYEKGPLVDKNGDPLDDRLKELNRQLASEKNEASRKEIEARIVMAKDGSKKLVDLSHKLLIFLDAPDPRLWDKIKPLLSHDTWESEYRPTMDTSMGTKETGRFLLRGWPAAIFCSARNEEEWSMWEEISSRFNIVSPSMSGDKRRMANELTAELTGLPSFVLNDRYPESLRDDAEREILRITEAIRDLQASAGSEGGGSPRDNLVYNPFGRILARRFPVDAGVRMRQFRRLLKYMNLFAFLNIEHRAVLVREDRKVGIVPNRQDLGKAFAMTEKGMATSLSPNKVDFFERFLRPALEGRTGLTTSQMRELLRSRGNMVGYSSLKQTYLDPLVDHGYLIAEPSPFDNKSNFYKLNPEAQRWSRLLQETDFDSQMENEVWNDLQTLIQKYSVRVISPTGATLATKEEFWAYLMDQA
ncbi:MAG TPA: hypothetical protein VMS77_06160 [Conexivisphaerales archaeon]|nr:hypothetical protein [Conexivisphaerales archaeon]